MGFPHLTKQTDREGYEYSRLPQYLEHPNTHHGKDTEPNDIMSAGIASQNITSTSPVLPTTEIPQTPAIQNRLQNDLVAEVETSLFLRIQNRFRQRTWSVTQSIGSILAIPFGLACFGVVGFAFYLYFAGKST